MTLTNQQKQQYEEEGYAVARGLFSDQEIQAVRSRMEQLVEDAGDWPLASLIVLDPQKHRAKNGGPVPFNILNPARREEVFKRVAQDERLHSAMSDLLGGEVFQSSDQALIRNGQINGGETYFHQDSYYWRLAPKIGCNAWITLNEVGREAGALAILPGTQRDWSLVQHEDYYDEPSFHIGSTGKAIQRHRIPLDQVNFDEEVLLPMQAGDVAFFTNYTWHRAERNGTGQHQYAYAVAYQRAEDSEVEETKQEEQ